MQIRNGDWHRTAPCNAKYYAKLYKQRITKVGTQVHAHTHTTTILLEAFAES